MTSPETTVLRQRLARLITQRTLSSADVSAIVEAAASLYHDLTVVLAPLIGSAGVSALTGRAFDLVRREYGAGEGKDEGTPLDNPFGHVSLWLETRVPSTATDAAAALFATIAELLATLIGEPLTMRFLEKAWPEGFSDAQPKGEKT